MACGRGIKLFSSPAARRVPGDRLPRTRCGSPTLWRPRPDLEQEEGGGGGLCGTLARSSRSCTRIVLVVLTTWCAVQLQYRWADAVTAGRLPRAAGAMGGSSGSDVDGSDLGEFLDDFASDSDDGEIAQETADSTRAWTILTAPSESAAAAAAVYAARTAERGEDAGSDDEQLPWRAQPEPLSEPAPRVGDCAISPLAAIIATLDGSAARNLLAQSPDLCPPQWQPMLLSLCDGDYLAVLSAAPARELLGLPVCAEEGDPAGEADGASATAEELRQRGNQLYKDAEYAAAAKSYTDAARVFKGQDCAQGQAGGRELCLLNRAACYLKLGHSLAAVADCNAVLLAQPESVKALFRRGQAFANVGNLARAKTDLAAAAKLSPKDAVSEAGTRACCFKLPTCDLPLYVPRSAKLLALLCVLLCALRECGRRSPTAKRGLKPKVLAQLRLRMSWRIFER